MKMFSSAVFMVAMILKLDNFSRIEMEEHDLVVLLANLIDNAIKREPDNLEHIKEKALIYKTTGDFSKAAQQYRYAIRKAINDDEYNLLLSDVLYDLIKLYPKGSVESREIYNEILTIAQNTENLDFRKQINDIADKALVFKKGEIENVG